MSLASLWFASLLAFGTAVPTTLQGAPAEQDSAPATLGQTVLEPGSMVQGTESIPAAGVDGAELTIEGRSLETLSALTDSRENKLAEIKALRARFDPDENSDRRLEQLAELRKLQQELNTIQFNFESVATGIDVRSFDLGVDQEFDLISEVKGLLKPIFSELREATEAPREMERLRAARDRAVEHQTMAREAVRNLEELVRTAEETVPDAEQRKALVDALRESQEGWRGRVQNLSNQETVAKFQLEQRESKRRSAWDSARSALGAFFKSRGLNLLIALGVFLGILFGLRMVHRMATRLLGKKSKGERKFYARLIDVVYFGFSGLAALGGALLVLYNASDWAILGLILLLLAGIAWAGKAAVPIFIEQIRLLLNLGTVREGERVIYQGLPWRVSRLSLHARLTNDVLVGGRIRVPLRDMTELRSRPVGPDEAWFPTKRDDWILLDGRLCLVIYQSTEVVRLRMQGGSEVNYPTSDFLGLAAENLHSGFRINTRFGIDYAHQAVCTEEVPQLMLEFLRERLADRFGTENMRQVKVEFLEAASSSLDYAILTDFDAAAAPIYNDLKRGIQRILVDACNKYGWGIPFTQITLHSAPNS